MKIQLLGLAALALVGAGCDQPDNECRSANLAFAANFTPVGGQDAACRIVGEPYRGDLISVQTYNYARADDPGRADLERSSIALKAWQLFAIYHGTAAAYGVGDPDVDNRDPGPETRALYARADFTSADPANSLCTAPTFFSKAQYTTTAEVPPVTCGGEGGGGGAGGGGGEAGGAGGAGCVPDSGLPALDVTYQWNNFKMVERSDAPGTIFSAELDYSETQTTNGTATLCTGKFNVLAIAPIVDCTIYDADGNPTDAGDVTLCDPEANPDAGRLAGSGLNPKLKNLLQCVKVGDFAFDAYQCVLVADSIETVVSTLESAE